MSNELVELLNSRYFEILPDWRIMMIYVQEELLLYD
jgi:hypothetical protein